MRVSDHVMRRLQTCVPQDSFEELVSATKKRELRDRPKIFILIAPQINACDYYRAFMVARELDKYDLFTVRFVHNLTPKEAYESDLMVVFRPKDPTFLNYTADPSAQNAALMADFDDDVFSVPRANFLNPNFTPPDKQTSLNIVSRVGQLTVSTRRLRSLLQASQSKVTVIQNLSDLDSYTKLLVHHPKQPNKRYRIGWAGTYTHTEDIMGGHQTFISALSEFMHRHQDTEMVFFGFCPEQFMNEFWGRVAYVEPVHLYQYMSTLAGLNLDLMVYPLMSHQFNYSKSNIRWLEASMVHVPVIASDIHSYREIGQSLCQTVPLNYEAWYNALEHAYLNRDEMRDRAERSREWVREQWSIQAMAPAWAAVYKAAATGGHIAQDFTPPRYQSCEERVSGDTFLGPGHLVEGREEMKRIETRVRETKEETDVRETTQGTGEGPEGDGESRGGNGEGRSAGGSDDGQPDGATQHGSGSTPETHADTERQQQDSVGQPGG